MENINPLHKNMVLAEDTVLSHSLADMQAIDWQHALIADQALLRLAKPSAALMDVLATRFALDPLHVTDLYNPTHPPHFTRLKNGAMHIILRFPIAGNDENESMEATSISILADEKLCALIWPTTQFHIFPDRDLLGLSIAGCVSKIIHVLVDYLLSRVYALREDMDEFEEACLADVNNADLAKLLLMRKEMSALARYARTNALAIEKLLLNLNYKDNLRLQDAHEHMNRATAIAEAKAEHALNVMQAAQSLLSQRLNEVMTFLAVITVILMPMSIIAGIFGMNFVDMKVLSYPNGFALSVWGMLLLGLILGVFFKIKKWW